MTRCVVLPRSTVLTAVLVLSAATVHAGSGHDHGASGHDDHAAHGKAISLTRWTSSHELLVELDAPVAGASFSYDAYVTDLGDHRPATAGTLTLRFEQDGFVIESHTDSELVRPGVFSAAAAAPRGPGAYGLFASFTAGDQRAEWDLGEVQIGASAPEAPAPEEGGEVRFPKEAQWQVPFRVEVASPRSVDHVIHATAVARSAPGSAAVVAAPTTGLLLWTTGFPVLGARVEQGDRLATLLPGGAAEHWSRVQAELATAAIDRDLARAERDRVKGLVARELLPERRLVEARAELARAEAEVESAERRASALTSGTSRAVEIRAPASGWVVSLGAAHGQAVEAGAPLVTVSTLDAVLLEGRVHERGRATLQPVTSLNAERGDWSAPRDLVLHGGRVLTERLIFDPERLSAPVVAWVDGEAGISPGDVLDLTIGVGEPAPTLAVPRGAVVEINAQPVIFVQRTGETFTRRRVELGRSNGAYVEIRTGIEPGERVVAEGGFDVHVASLSGALESHRH